MPPTLHTKKGKKIKEAEEEEKAMFSFVRIYHFFEEKKSDILPFALLFFPQGQTV